MVISFYFECMTSVQKKLVSMLSLASREIASHNLLCSSHGAKKWRGEWESRPIFSGISNPRVLSDMGLAIPRPTRLGDPRSVCLRGASPPSNCFGTMLQPAAAALQLFPSVSSNGSSSNNNSFENYLKAQNKRNVRQIMCYAQRYAAVLQTGDASSIASLSSAAARRHAMESLSALSKYYGIYNTVWKDIRDRYQLKWSNSEQDNLRYFTNYLQGHGNFDAMMSWLKDALNKLPSQTANILLYNVLTGLRPTEAILSIKLIQTDLQNYANKETGMLENFRYPEGFIRKNKKS
jgi:hypothetical protein